MNIELNEHLPRQAVQILIDKHGLWRTLRAVLVAGLRRDRDRDRDRRRARLDLPDHLMRDIGLPPTPPRAPDWWLLR